MGIDPELIGQVVSKVGDRLSIKIRGMTYNTRIRTLFKIGDKVRATFEGGSRTIIALKRIKVGDKSADDIFDDFISCDNSIDYCEIEWSNCETNEEPEEITCMTQDMME